MKLVRTATLIIALAGATTVYAQAPQKAPAEKKAPDAKAPADKAAPPAKEEISAAEAQKVLDFFNKFADAIVANKDSCPKMAVAINGVIDTNKAFIEQANKMKADGKKLPKAVEDKMGARMKEFLPMVMKCKDDKDVAAAMQRMDKPDAKPAAPAPAPKKDAAAPAPAPAKKP
jgi:hypothetical protein